MKIVNKILKWSLYLLLIPIIYIIISLFLSSITVNKNVDHVIFDKSIYLSTNGVHLDIVIPKSNLDSLLLSGIKQDTNDSYLSFGWGDENFYINTPTWGDLTVNNAFNALFFKSTTLLHITRHKEICSDWIEVKVNKSELEKLNSYVLKTFETGENGIKIMLENEGYTSNDSFYKSKGSYSCFKTCNSWVNMGFKEAGLKSCLWTPFDFGLIKKYK